MLLLFQTRTESSFERPAANTDKLYMNIGKRDVIEVQHPIPAGKNHNNRLIEKSY